MNPKQASPQYGMILQTEYNFQEQGELHAVTWFKRMRAI
jgi:hypothetical protein